MNRGICRNSRQIWRKYENTAEFGHINIETSCTGDGRNSGVLSFFPRDEQWCVFTRHRRRKVICLHSSPKKNSVVSSLTTKGEKWCVFVYHQRQNSAVSSPSPTKKQKCLRLSRIVEHGFLRSLPTKEKWHVFIYHLRRNSGVFAHYQWRNSGVSSFITNNGQIFCFPL